MNDETSLEKLKEIRSKFFDARMELREHLRDHFSAELQAVEDILKKRLDSHELFDLATAIILARE